MQQSSSIPLLSEAQLPPRVEAIQQSPITILQIGEGNFLRGFVDWMIQVCREKGIYNGGIAVSQPRPSGKAKLEALKRQDGCYTLVTRGLAGGEQVERAELISVFGAMLNPYEQWDELLKLAEQPELEVIVSNTTEAGLAYSPEPYVEGQAAASFPGKITLLLYHRFQALNGAEDKGLLLLPCELLERNGDELKRCVLQYCADWSLPDAFISWVMNHNQFLNSLVDRIVAGYPQDEAQAWFEEWGYRDELLNTAEPYHFWAIEAGAEQVEELDRKLPLRQAGLNVHLVPDLKPYQLRKVRILNGAHTLMTPLGILHGLEQVRDVMEHEQLGTFVRETVEQHIVPLLPLPVEELQEYASSVFERFCNPFIRHRLSDIAMNSISKFKVRLLPSLLAYIEQGKSVPDQLAHGFAALLRYYKVNRSADGDGSYSGLTFTGDHYTVRDDMQSIEQLSKAWEAAAVAATGSAATESAVTGNGSSYSRMAAKGLLACSDVWGRDLSGHAELAAQIASCLEEMEMKS